MIEIQGRIVSAEQLAARWSLTEEEQAVLAEMGASPHTHRYESPDLLRFELTLRKNILRSSLALYRSGVDFAVFEESRCNERYWERTRNGGFLLRPGVSPSAAINDIFFNGNRYAFECATAIPIIYYKAVLESIPESTFNRLFQNLYLYSWNHDTDLDIESYVPRDYFLGDVRYFKNPQVNPEHIEWQGINAVILGEDRYYGHGVGIRSAREIIAALNEQRRPGATQSAYLMDSVTRPDFRQIYRYSQSGPMREPDVQKIGLQAKRRVQESIPYEQFRLSGQNGVTIRIGSK